MALFCYGYEPSAVKSTANVLNMSTIMRCTIRDSKLKIKDATQGITLHKSTSEIELWYMYLSTVPSM